MNGLSAALWSEWLKVRQAKIFPVTLIFFGFIAVMMGLLMFVAKHPELAGRSAALNTKASLVGDGSWPSFLSLLIQVILALGPIGFGIVTSWVFGREYSDRVVKDILALPVPRSRIVIAKLLLVLIWCVLLTLTFFVVAAVVGLIIHIPGGSSAIVWNGFLTFMISALLTMVLCPVVALIASVSRGYLLAIGFVVLFLILTQLVGVGMPGIMPYFPWAIPALCSGVAGSDLPQPGLASYLILALTSLFGVIGTVLWWKFADQT